MHWAWLKRELCSWPRIPCGIVTCILRDAHGFTKAVSGHGWHGAAGAGAAAGSYFGRGPAQALGIGAVIGLPSVWGSLVFANDTGIPVGFFVATVTAVFFGLGRLWSRLPELERLEGASTGLHLLKVWAGSAQDRTSLPRAEVPHVDMRRLAPYDVGTP